jgi:uncharacterized membrane protein
MRPCTVFVSMQGKANRFIRISGREATVVAALTLAGLLTRLYGLSEWHLVGDEYYTVRDTLKSTLSPIDPAYYALTWISFQLFGVSEWSARLPAFLLGTISVPLFYITSRPLIGHRAAAIGTLFVVLSSWHLWYSQSSRFYTGVFLFGMLAYFLYYRAITRNSLKYLAAAMASNAIGILFHATSVLISGSCALFSIIVLTWRRLSDSGLSRRVATAHLSICILAALLASPFLLHILADWRGTGQNWGYGPATLILQVAKYVQIPIALSAVLGLIALAYRNTQEGLFFGLGIGVPTILLVVSSAFMAVRPDYIFYTLPLIFALAGYLCDRAAHAQLRQNIASFALAAVIVATMLPEFISYYTGRRTLDVREAIEFVENAYQPADRILSFVPGANFQFYAKGEYSLERYPGYPYDNAVDWKRALQPYKEGGRRLWILLPVRRHPLAEGLESWLLCNASLVWRKNELRYDYSVMGYEIFLADHPGATRTCR